jgi:hypothetical protein
MLMWAIDVILGTRVGIRFSFYNEKRKGGMKRREIIKGRN